MRGGRRRRAAIRHRSNPERTISSRPRQQFPQPLQAKENASSRPRSGCVRVKSTCPHRSICESLSIVFPLFQWFCSIVAQKRPAKKRAFPLSSFLDHPSSFSCRLAGTTMHPNRLRMYTANAATVALPPKCESSCPATAREGGSSSMDAMDQARKARSTYRQLRLL